MAFLAMGLALLWGFGGILSLGQSAFLGLGGYAYGVIAINLAGIPGQTGFALAGGITVAVLIAALLSWIMFYGRLRGVYVAIVMLVVTLLLETFLNQTAGPQWAIGAANLGGNNGLGRFSGSIQDLPSLKLGFGEGALELAGASYEFYYVTLGPADNHVSGPSRSGEFAFWDRTHCCPRRSGPNGNAGLRRAATAGSSL
jgi:branched-chain amino acid transport system permease protein